MPSTGAPGNIWYPDDTAPVAPLEDLFLQQATSVNDALASVSVPRVADFDALASYSGVAGDLVRVLSGDMLFMYDTGWSQITRGIFSTTSARDAAYAKGSGAFKIAGNARVLVVADSKEYTWSGTAWMQSGGPVETATLTPATGSTIVAQSLTKWNGLVTLNLRREQSNYWRGGKRC